MSNFVFPDITICLIGILGLLVVWQYYKMQIMAGRILAVDIFDRSGIRMYLYATPDDSQVCDTCAQANGRVYLSSKVARKSFSPLERPCQRPTPCPGVLVGLYGGWLEARGVVERLRANSKEGMIQLAPEQLRGVVGGAWERSVSAETDRISIFVLEAMSYEKINRDVAIGNYGYVVAHANEIRHLMLLVPVYLRLTHMLVQAGRVTEALAAIEQFNNRFPISKMGKHFPSPEQRELMKRHEGQMMKSQVLKRSA